jgi:UrcA family protein
MKKLLILALASVSMAAGAPAAMATQDYREMSAVVPYHDLDLGTAEGVAQLDQRIASAAERLCSASGPPTLRELRMTADCVAAARARAAGDVEIALARVGPGGPEVAQVRIIRSLRP